ncbi:DUF4118 domain-containing protein [Ferrovibrio sp.]|uniref:sensor histidine kinase n=1 Tax=Ferrovibrio sp. TaxID=1917215 RepID=UPI0035ADD1F6
MVFRNTHPHLGEPVEMPPVRVFLQSVAALGLVVLTGVVVFVLSHSIRFTSASVFFVPVVLGAAIFGGMIPSLVSALSAVAVCSFFFYEPILSLHVSDPQELADLIVFAVVAVVTSQVADFARRAMAASRRREAMMQYLLDFSRRIGAVPDPAAIPMALAVELGKGLGCGVALYVDEDGGLNHVAQAGDFNAGDPDRQAQLAWHDGAANEAGSLPTYPLRSGGRPIGLAVLASAPMSKIDSLTVSALMEQVAAMLERTRLTITLEEARIAAKAEDLREAVLSSISHDLHTPLASILGSVTTLESFGPRCDEAVRRDLQATIREAAERLERYIRKMLDLTRIRSGRLQPHPEPVDVADIVDVALRQTARALADRPVSTAGLFDLPMVQADPVLIEQALINILENAGKYSPPGTPIAIAGRVDGQRLVLSVRDEGIGLDKSDLGRIFALYYRAGPPDGQVAGSGLGLMVSKAFVEATGCDIWAESAGPGRGATFCIGLPLASVLQVADEGEAI